MNGQRCAEAIKVINSPIAAKLRSRRFLRCYYGVPVAETSRGFADLYFSNWTSDHDAMDAWRGDVAVAICPVLAGNLDAKAVNDAAARPAKRPATDKLNAHRW